MRPLKILFVIFLLFLTRVTSQNPTSDEDDSPIIQTSFGPVQGLRFVSSWTKKVIYSFRGIPYASPPVGKLRFKDPVSPEKWTSVKNCTEDQSACPQLDFFGQSNVNVKTSEDCLYINVYTPQMRQDDELLPVMVWVHGGAFLVGSGNYEETGPDFLVAEGVIVVTFNYRLGALGFLSLDLPEASGNAALKDQRLALQWVQREIKQFGGNADSVTLFGESAGSASVHLHYLSPMSKGLFHRVIGESGTALTSWSVRDNAAEYGLRLAAALNCSTTDVSAALKCLVAADVQELVSTQVRVPITDEDAKNGRSIVFIPSIDKQSKEPFLPYYPKMLLEQKKGSFVSFIMGINSDEGMMAIGMSNDEERIKNITNNLDTVIPMDIKNNCSEARIDLLTKRIKQFYFKDSVPSFSNLRGYVDLFTDVLFGYSTAVSARLYKDRATVYLYYFAFNGAYKEKPTEFIIQNYNFSGVSHAEELSYIFVRQKVNQTSVEGSKETKTWKRMTRLWTNFAKYGTPTVAADPELDNVTWSPVGNVMTRFLQVGENLTMESSNFLSDRVALWDTVTPSRSAYLQATAILLLTICALQFSK